MGTRGWHKEAEICRRPEVRKILQSLRDGVLNEIKPTFSSDGFAYLEVEKIMGSPKSKVREVLEKLDEAGILLSELAETRITCPSCGSVSLSIKPLCPSCGSSKLIRGEAIEHLPCGHLDFEGVFQSEKGMVCPKCRKPLKALGVDYRKPGKFYKCLSCGEFFGIPKKMFVCVKCGREFDEEEATVLNALIYRPNPEKRDVILRESIDFKPIMKRLKELGWLATHTAFLRGKSNVVYSFPLLISAKNNGFTEPYIIVQILIEERPIGEDPILSLYAKALDVNVKNVVLGVIPKLSSSAKKLARHYGFHVVEASDPKNLTELLLEALEKVLTKRGGRRRKLKA